MALTPEERRKLSDQLAGMDVAYVKQQVLAIKDEAQLTAKQLVAKYQKRVDHLEGLLAVESSWNLDGQTRKQLQRQLAEDRARVELYQRYMGSKRRGLSFVRQAALLRAFRFAGGRLDGELAVDSAVVVYLAAMWRYVAGEEIGFDRVRKVIYRYRKEHCWALTVDEKGVSKVKIPF